MGSRCERVPLGKGDDRGAKLKKFKGLNSGHSWHRRCTPVCCFGRHPLEDPRVAGSLARLSPRLVPAGRARRGWPARGAAVSATGSRDCPAMVGLAAAGAVSAHGRRAGRVGGRGRADQAPRHAGGRGADVRRRPGARRPRDAPAGRDRIRFAVPRAAGSPAVLGGRQPDDSRDVHASHAPERPDRAPGGCRVGPGRRRPRDRGAAAHGHAGPGIRRRHQPGAAAGVRWAVCVRRSPPERSGGDLGHRLPAAAGCDRTSGGGAGGGLRCGRLAEDPGTGTARSHRADRHRHRRHRGLTGRGSPGPGRGGNARAGGCRHPGE